MIRKLYMNYTEKDMKHRLAQFAKVNPHVTLDDFTSEKIAYVFADFWVKPTVKEIEVLLGKLVLDNVLIRRDSLKFGDKFCSDEGVEGKKIAVWRHGEIVNREKMVYKGC